MKISSASILIVSILFFSGCKNKTPEPEILSTTFSTFVDDSIAQGAPLLKEEIFYGLVTPVEVSDIFNRLGIRYESTVMNPYSNGDLYLTSASASLNLGVYGVDMGYLKQFGVTQEMLNYMVTINRLSEKLGIPVDYFTEPLKIIESDPSNTDTIVALMNEAYINIDEHLRQDGRESSVGLIVMGGWVEALYIATQLVYDPANPDPQVIQKIAEQKYTLNSLLSFMKNYYDDPMVVFYTKKLLYLKRYFDRFDIYYRAGDLEIDSQKQVLRASGSDMTITVETLNDIKSYVEKLRGEITAI